ncbi:MAG: hypothetical protein JKY65_05575 [Planctomycetes bacterium]|nr:hypothetical protein [Planctomycetota bacterium]
MRIPLVTLLVVACLSGGVAQAQSKRKDLAPVEGSVAPDFDLFKLQADGSTSKKKVKLSSFKGKKAVALVFGSYT